MACQGRRGNQPQRAYNVFRSTQRLSTRGFHPKVTALSLEEYFEKWMQMHDAINRKTFASDHEYVGPIGIKLKRFTIVSRSSLSSLVIP